MAVQLGSALSDFPASCAHLFWMPSTKSQGQNDEKGPSLRVGVFEQMSSQRPGNGGCAAGLLYHGRGGKSSKSHLGRAEKEEFDVHAHAYLSQTRFVTISMY